MKIRLAALQNGRNQLTEAVPPAELGLDPALYPDSLEVSLEIDRSPGKAALKVIASGKRNFRCDRCGEDFVQMLSGDCSVMFIQREAPFPDEAPGDDLRSYRVGQETIDVTAEVIDALLLDIPYKILCREDCRGLCQRCGANLNTEACRCVTETGAVEDRSAQSRRIDE